MRRLRAVVLAAVAVAGLYCGVSEFRERRARAFCDSLRPLLARYYAEHGHYPESLPPQWYRLSDLPNLMRPDFYLTFSNGQAFLMRFVNPQRPSFDNVVAYQSDIGHWASWDGYLASAERWRFDRATEALWLAAERLVRWAARGRGRLKVPVDRAERHRMPWEALAWMAFWSWVVFLGGADRIATDGWVMAYLVEPLPKKADPVHVLRLIGIVNLIVGAIVLVWAFF